MKLSKPTLLTGAAFAIGGAAAGALVHVILNHKAETATEVEGDDCCCCDTLAEDADAIDDSADGYDTDTSVNPNLFVPHPGVTTTQF